MNILYYYGIKCLKSFLCVDTVYKNKKSSFLYLKTKVDIHYTSIKAS